MCVVSRCPDQRSRHSGNPPQSPTVPGEGISDEKGGEGVEVLLPPLNAVILAYLQVELIRRDYVANGGWETFLSYEDPEQDILIGLLRLRRCSPQSFRPELKGGASIVRELHVYGSVVPVSSRDPSKFQHQVDFSLRIMTIKKKK